MIATSKKKAWRVKKKFAYNFTTSFRCVVNMFLNLLFTKLKVEKHLSFSTLCFPLLINQIFKKKYHAN
jgi:hypothetical protein